MSNIDWIFFDIGSTLVDETLAYEHRFHEGEEESGIPFDKIYSTAVNFYKQGEKGDSQAFKLYNIKKKKWHFEDEFLYPYTVKTLAGLSKNYKLGIIANQDLGTEKRLENFGILKYFNIVLSSAEEGVAKPNLEIFKRAVRLADTTAEQSVMVGDRLDNDIIPAKVLGFKTIWVRQGFAGLMPKSMGYKWADLIVDSIEEINFFILTNMLQTT